MRKRFIIDVYTAGSEQPVHVSEIDVQKAVMDKFTDYFVDVRSAEGT